MKRRTSSEVQIWKLLVMAPFKSKFAAFVILAILALSACCALALAYRKGNGQLRTSGSNNQRQLVVTKSFRTEVYGELIGVSPGLNGSLNFIYRNDDGDDLNHFITFARLVQHDTWEFISTNTVLELGRILGTNTNAIFYAEVSPDLSSLVLHTNGERNDVELEWFEYYVDLESDAFTMRRIGDLPQATIWLNESGLRILGDFHQTGELWRDEVLERIVSVSELRQHLPVGTTKRGTVFYWGKSVADNVVDILEFDPGSMSVAESNSFELRPPITGVGFPKRVVDGATLIMDGRIEQATEWNIEDLFNRRRNRAREVEVKVLLNLKNGNYWYFTNQYAQFQRFYSLDETNVVAVGHHSVGIGVLQE